MTGTISMLDTAFNSQFEPGWAAYAGYVDGGVGDQPNFSYIVTNFPAAHHLSVTVTGQDADCADIESGAMSPESVPGWFARQKARGIARPCIYASVSTMAEMVPVFETLPGSRAAVRLWSAHYGAGEHICGPFTCGQVGIGMDGTQWTSSALGRTLDQSLLLGSFFGTTPPGGPQYVEFNMSMLAVLKQGDSDKPGGFWPVHRLQALLATAGKINGIPAAAGLAEDGAFGAKTSAAVKAVQGHYGISADGIAGAQTWSVLLTGSAS